MAGLARKARQDAEAAARRLAEADARQKAEREADAQASVAVMFIEVNRVVSSHLTA